MGKNKDKGPHRDGRRRGFPVMHEMFVPKAIFFTNGVGVHKDRLSSFELALRDAGIEKANLVTVSSIFSPTPRHEMSRKERRREKRLIMPGQIAVHCVMARQDTNRVSDRASSRASSRPRASPRTRTGTATSRSHHSYGETREEVRRLCRRPRGHDVATTLGVEFDAERRLERARAGLQAGEDHPRTSRRATSCRAPKVTRRACGPRSSPAGYLYFSVLSPRERRRWAERRPARDAKEAGVREWGMG